MSSRSSELVSGTARRFRRLSGKRSINAPRHLDRPAQPPAEQTSSEAESRQLTVMFCDLVGRGRRQSIQWSRAKSMAVRSWPTCTARPLLSIKVCNSVFYLSWQQGTLPSFALRLETVV